MTNEQKGTRLNPIKENKKVGNQDDKTVSVTIYNATLNSFGDYIQTLNYKTNNNINKKKANSTNQKNHKFFLKQSTVASARKPANGIKKEETRTIGNIVNNLSNYMPININENNYLGLKKKK